ncbi:N-acetylmuramoyl-L-alanine amidase [Edwardsiella anguillarum]|uniref:N-acetylmuramoyl-L-alanine amidase n=1 Tax=Edwardsiella anguillarum TaxID=1821960 RepID=UPI0024B65F26|nr:N-acetylmuramoyl-L-alanine amidase [Edwardsiella anguillarum]WHP79104.1 N-acetylmuramoyl-L-alanine amidase [Edwardsiella anguillarum]WHQ16562.1 N-acetylmuramoyl-L-alanine amidase [Edwardsiella anguillarum]WHQ20097.1 N-acetylmuramoyl-L-alanine amidase [Edwardsiella anguillarum]WHQ23618.1 N-acetylmuramoyl-L-alanine amidase [Edwardsiella anguillarum]WHQ27189.1 N-acetylmuramoyl-L-alanine amidase [Edwardsiella anguillarum]
MWGKTSALLALLLLVGCQQSPTLRDRGGYWVDDSQRALRAEPRIRYLVLHYTAEDFPSSLRVLTGKRVSAHYLVPAVPPQRDGRPVVWQLVPESRSAWHAGISYWRGQTHLNDNSIGIEIENPGYRRTPHGIVWYPFTPQQITAVRALAQDIVRRYAIAPQNVVGHMDIAPQRKVDPGPLFPWQMLAQQGIGAWPEAARVRAYLQRYRQRPPDVAYLQRRLAQWGYQIEPSGINDAASRRVIAAFQMHFRPTDFRGEPDAETSAIVDALIAQYGGAD